MMIRKFIQNEIRAFDTFDSNGKRLIIVNLLYAMVFPFVIIFSTAYINRATGNQVIAIINSFGFVGGMVAGNFSNGKLLQKGINIRYLFSAGMFFSIASTFLMMLFVKSSIGGYIIFYGFFSGLGSGLYWSNRQFLSLLVTNEENRNFFASLDQFFIIFFNAIIPFLFGTLFISLGRETGWFDEIMAYQLMAAFMVVLILYAIRLILKSTFASPEIKKFVHFRFSKLWQLHRVFALLFGFVSGGFLFFMPLLILNVAGDETVLGKIELTMAIVSVSVIYTLGRITAVNHRSKMMFVGALVVVAGGFFLSSTINNDKMFLELVKYSFLGVIIMKICQVAAEPVINVAYASTKLSNFEKATKIENRDSYTYVFDNEVFVGVGRIMGGLVFISLNYWVSSIGALQYIFIILGLLQIITSLIIKKVTAIKVS
jgi:YQGE family putative transporter